MSRTVIVTGGARRIGASVVRTLARRGHRVVIHHHKSSADAAVLAQEVGAIVVAGDLSEPGAAEAIFASARAAAGGVVDGLVNCASIFEYDSPRNFDPGLLLRLTQVNLSAPVNLAVALAAQPDLTGGAVVNILDQKVGNPNPDFFSYSCTKMALEGATRMLAQALAPRVRVNAVSPGLSLPSHDQTQAEFTAVAGQNLLQRQIVLDEIGAAVDFLLTNSAVTGQNLFVDNGQRFLPRDSDVMFSTRTADER